MWRSRWDAGVLKAEALALLPCGLGMAFSQSHVMAARRHQHSRLIIEVDEYSSNPTQAFTFYNINQGRFQPPHVQMVDPVPHDAPKPPGYTRFVCVSDTHSRTDPIQMPYGDVLIHAGDFTELGLPSEVKKFNEWLGSLPYEYKIVIAGNHELTFDQEFMADLIKQDFYYFPSVSKLKPENYENVQSLLTNCIYLQDSEVTVRGFRIYGSPWLPGLGPQEDAAGGLRGAAQHGAEARPAAATRLWPHPRRVWCHGRWDDHLCERVRMHCELPAREPTHSHRPPHTPELLTAPHCPSPARPRQLHRPCLATVPSMLSRLDDLSGCRDWPSRQVRVLERLFSLLSPGVGTLRIPIRGSVLITFSACTSCVYLVKEPAKLMALSCLGND
ncbi:metallophosphoesterase domain-containing protein 1 isoform X1 [Callithrix jacchus]|nr:metallophosphoesterase domain-containing protein 1 isoform X3 [Callithrix jacchus]XP_035121370.1 metallophosphoesterase domain-containing protein 1 isoform X3 [Callithrix jacchus]XP_054094781.1 metallophosphoesterase domain-containing protein 1 isoform X3 [Callithrix jacchus]